ncbi:ABC transporter ATP-binding protein [Thioalkalivibrio sp. ALJT]|uniref:ABC transporter ATP-binding protein n=1 Tax=Thioalkalivibrio sp. ALJT TaxID=1158146 RepID=UPI00035D374F|nr:ABC transporter ATP-binding protein [Thioalkalivibrio sp. ALJT]
MSTFRKTLELFSARERRRGALVLIMVVGMAALETLGVASILPFLAVLGDPDLVHTQPLLRAVFDGMGFVSVDAFLLFLGGGAFALVLVSTLFRSLTVYAMNRFVEMRRHAMSERLLDTYLRQPYPFFLDRHSGDLSKTILSEVDQIAHYVFRPGMQIVAYGMVVLAMVVLLVVVDPLLAVVVVGLMGGLYALIYVFARRALQHAGQDRARANGERFVAAAEALAGIKEIKLLGYEEAYLKRFRGPSMRQSSHQAFLNTLGEIPKFAVEAIAFGGVIALTLALMVLHGGASARPVNELLPILGLYAFAGYRILPAAQRVYAGFSQLRFSSALIDALHDDLVLRSSGAEIIQRSQTPLRPQAVIEMQGLTYRYPGTSRAALEGVNAILHTGESIGIVGGSGAGKTTLVDVILGLLRPQAGAIRVDGVSVYSSEQTLRDWQAAIGYVPQEIFLSDGSVAENIAFGVEPDRIDMERVVKAARMAQIEGFVRNELPQGFDSRVGERGVRLSGGQRQRLGIARALYHDPPILIFDEATSALDTVTEAAVMESIYALAGPKTVLMVAHRLSTVRECDRILLLDQGAVVAEGSFAELEEREPRFAALVRQGG